MKNFTIPDGVVIAFIFLFPFLFGQEIDAKMTSLPTQLQQDLLEVKIDRLVVDPSSMQLVVLLQDASGKRVMPIWIGPNEAAAIQGELEGTRPPRPMTHDLLERVIQRLNGTVRRVIITQQKERCLLRYHRPGKRPGPHRIRCPAERFHCDGPKI
jgi:hypothetical protein